jgi:hypothetical protein
VSRFPLGLGIRVGVGEGEVGGEYAEDDMIHSNSPVRKETKGKTRLRVLEDKERRYACGEQGPTSKVRVGWR